MDEPQVIWSGDNEVWSSTMTKQWYHFHTSRQLRRFGNAIGQEVRDSMRMIHVQLDDAAMAEELLRFKNLVIIRILNDDAGALQVSTLHTLRDKLKSLRAGLAFLADVAIQDPGNAANFLPFEEFFDAVMNGTMRKQLRTSDSSSEVSSREPTPGAWASS